MSEQSLVNLKRINKGQIINRLISQFAYSRYLEYNKFDGASYYEDIVCAHKEIAYLPEDSYLDSENIKRLLGLASQVDFNRIMDLNQLLEFYSEQKFDIIFFDPVHIRPEVDLSIRALIKLLNPGGILVIHDCNPERKELTSLRRRKGQWVGETFKAFSLFRQYNWAQTCTVAEDFGVGLIWNSGLNLDYPIQQDLHYEEFAKDRYAYIGLIDYDIFYKKTEAGKVADLFKQNYPSRKVNLYPQRLAEFEAKTAKTNPVNSYEAQLFWRLSGQVFSESCSQIVRWKEDDGRKTLCFKLPADSIELRFDFADRIISAQVMQFTLKNDDDEIIWQCVDAAASFRRLVNMRVYCDKANQFNYFYALTGDPQCYIDLSDLPVRAQSRNLYLNLSITKLPYALHQLLQAFNLENNASDLKPLYQNLIRDFIDLSLKNKMIEYHVKALRQLC